MKNRKYPFITGLLAVLCAYLLGLGIISPRPVMAATASQDRHVITLMSSSKPIDVSTIPRLEAFNVYRLYITTHKKGTTTWYRLRLGFFPDKGSAKKVSKLLKGLFKDTWISKVSDEERTLSDGLQVKWPGQKRVKRPKKARIPVVSKKAVSQKKPEEAPLTGVQAKAKGLMDEAEEAMTGGKHKSAIGLYKGILGLKGHTFSKSAQELLGLARERNGELAQAKAEYMTYLVLYPEGKDSDRVRQRLSALETARAKPKKRLKKAKDKKRSSTRVYGSFSQFYHRDDSYTDLGGKVINRFSVSNDMDLTISHNKNDFIYTTVLIVGYEHDFLNKGKDSRTNLSRAYFDVLDRNRQISLRLGRQSRSTGGVLGRFDGAFFSYQVVGQVKLNMVAGYPVNSAVFEKFITDKHFYGMSMDLGTFADHWDFNLFLIRQKAEDITDREAIGIEARYFDIDKSFFSLIDYDTSYNKLNTLLMTANIKISAVTRVNALLDLRKSPILTTSNALQGQTVTSLSDLNLTFTEDEIRALAVDRTAKNSSILIGVTRELSNKVQISGDITISELTGTPASGGVEATSGSGYEYFLSTQVVGSGLIKTGDTSIVGLRYSDTSSSNRLTFDVNTRYPFSRKWRLNPKVRVDYSWNLNNSINLLKIKPSFRSDYYWKKHIKFEFDGGADFGYELDSAQNNNTRDYFFTFGYRMNF